MIVIIRLVITAIFIFGAVKALVSTASASTGPVGSQPHVCQYDGGIAAHYIESDSIYHYICGDGVTGVTAP